MRIRVLADQYLTKLPAHATPGSAGLDIHAATTQAFWDIRPGEMQIIDTALHIELPPFTVGLLCNRSSMAIKNRVVLGNVAAVIDSDYRGEIRVPLANMSHEPYRVYSGQRIAQLVVMPYIPCYMEYATDLSATQRGKGGL